MNPNPTAYFLRHAISKKYLTSTGEWTNDPTEALQFETAAAAMRHRQSCAISWAVVDPPMVPSHTPPRQPPQSSEQN